MAFLGIFASKKQQIWANNRDGSNLISIWDKIVSIIAKMISKK